jgi:hopanoid C-3 methylase
MSCRDVLERPALNRAFTWFTIRGNDVSVARPSQFADVLADLLAAEPLGLERVAAAAREAGHEVRIIDLQVFSHAELAAEVASFRPCAVGISLNYLANVPEAIEISVAVKQAEPGCLVFLGGHSVSFVAGDVLVQAEGCIDAVIRGDGETAVGPLLAAVRDGGLDTVPGAVSLAGRGPAPQTLHSIDAPRPARDLTRRRRRYFIGELDPCASIEFSRGCPWDRSFCSAWTFYGRAYRKASSGAAAAELASIREPDVFIVDDVAFIRPGHGHGIAAELERRRIRKRYYLETRSDVLLRNLEVFERWTRLGLRYMFLGMEAIDAEGLDLYRKRVSPDDNFRALEAARRLGIAVAINLIVDPAWDAGRFRATREFALAVPEIVHLTVMTPYPGTEIWHTEARRLTTRDYRLFDIQHAVVPTTLPLQEFYRELVRTQAVINRKHLGLRTAFGTARILGANLARGQTTSLGCSGSSARSTTPTGSTLITIVPSGISFRFPRPGPATAASSVSTPATYVPVPPRRPRSRDEPGPGAAR